MRTSMAVIGILLLCVLGAHGQNPVDEGIVLYEQGRYSEAAEKLTLATAADKKNDAAWLYLGSSLLKAGKSRDAARSLNNVRSGKKIKVNGLDKELDVFSRPRPSYTEAARRNSTSGRMRVVVEMLASGRLGSITLLDELPDGLTGECIYAAQMIKFRPAIRNGQPVSSVRIVEYSFEVRVGPHSY